MLAHEREDLVRGPALLGQRLVEELRVGADLAEDRPLQQPLAVRRHRVGGQPSEPPHLVGREVELVHGAGDCSMAAEAVLGSKGRGFREFAIEGFEVLVGKGDAENDALTFGVADPHDFWLHVAGPAGSHVVVRNPDKLAELPRPVLEAAAVPGRLALQGPRQPRQGRGPRLPRRRTSASRAASPPARSSSAGGAR